MKKLLFFLFILIFSINEIYSQENFEFNYDADGNMIARRLIVEHVSQATAKTVEKNLTGNEREGLDNRKITIFPNPTHGRIVLSILPLDTNSEGTYTLYDSSGRLLKTNKIDSEISEIEIIGNTGIYLLDIRIDEEISQWKIIRQ